MCFDLCSSLKHNIKVVCTQTHSLKAINLHFGSVDVTRGLPSLRVVMDEPQKVSYNTLPLSFCFRKNRYLNGTS